MSLCVHFRQTDSVIETDLSFFTWTFYVCAQCILFISNPYIIHPQLSWDPSSTCPPPIYMTSPFCFLKPIEFSECYLYMHRYGAIRWYTNNLPVVTLYRPGVLEVIVQTRLTEILLYLLTNCWDYKCVPPC